MAAKRIIVLFRHRRRWGVAALVGTLLAIFLVTEIASQPEASLHSEKNYDSVATRPPLGTEPAPQSRALAAEDFRKVPFLPELVLTGISMRESGGSAVVLADEAGRQRLVELGEVVATGWSISAIGHSHAVLTHRSGVHSRLDWRSEMSESSGAATRHSPPDKLDFNALLLSLERDDAGYRLISVPASLAALGLRKGDVLTRFDDDDFASSERIDDLSRRITNGMGGTLSYQRGMAVRQIMLPRN